MLRFANILCPVDFDQNSLAAVPIAARLAQEQNATLCLLHVIHLHPPAEPALSFAEAEAKARTRLEQLAHQKFKAGTRYELLVITGDPAAEVLQVAAGLGDDLIVMATHGRRGFRRLVLGSVAERVVREAPCPVLTVRPNAARGGASRTRPGA